MDADTRTQLAGLLAGTSRWVVFSGAGMSAESGVPTFRDAPDSLWSRFDPMRLASVDGWQADPELVWGWYLWRMARVRAARPHAGYAALARLQEERPGLAVLTQNVDDLHERAGIAGVTHLHGELFAHRCFACAHPAPDPVLPDAGAPTPMRVAPPRCAQCGDAIRPGVVWFGEALPEEAWARAQERVQDCDLMLVVGTSGLVYPAAMLPEMAAAGGARLVEINPEASTLPFRVDLHLRCGAAAGLQAVLDAL